MMLFDDDFAGGAVGVADDDGLAASGVLEANAAKVVIAFDFFSGFVKFYGIYLADAFNIHIYKTSLLHTHCRFGLF